MREIRRTPWAPAFLLVFLLPAVKVVRAQEMASALPDSPGAVAQQANAASHVHTTPRLPPCPVATTQAQQTLISMNPPATCIVENPLRLVVDYTRQPLNARQKGVLALRDFIGPFNLLALTAQAGISVASNPHSAYGPGFEGWGRLTGYSLVESAQGEFFGTFLIPAITQEDPRYRRMKHASVKRRVLHALQRTVIAEHDDGSAMPNYATLLTYPICAELNNLYVPGIQSDGVSTAKRIGLGLATDPIGNLIAEFLPDIARRIHVRAIFVQQIVNHMTQGESSPE